ncbi:hypothetical protein JHK82_024717 [Glycine max]|uniref:Putative 60S ribosomal protein L14 n=1 Tax=Glycine soja TaxID=3848 RepID=A0A0B2PTZ7_GLYSO|nr:hypothetical protein JHK82_024717 [Glycine max]KHN11037.1 Putative 60S ribosomal protein L14 [Glycine soja]
MLHPSCVSSEFGLNALYDSVNGGGDVWINENCFRIPFKRYVEIGRVAQINYGKEYGRLVVIVDVIDQNRALVDAPDMVRSQVNFKRLSLTDIKIDIKRVPKKKDLVKAMEDMLRPSERRVHGAGNSLSEREGHPSMILIGSR